MLIIVKYLILAYYEKWISQIIYNEKHTFNSKESGKVTINESHTLSERMFIIMKYLISTNLYTS